MSSDEVQTIIEMIREVQDPAQAAEIRRAATVHALGLSGEAADPERHSVGANEAGFKVGDAVEFGEHVRPRRHR